jgi:hypothetical protein
MGVGLPLPHSAHVDGLAACRRICLLVVLVGRCSRTRSLIGWLPLLPWNVLQVDVSSSCRQDVLSLTSEEGTDDLFAFFAFIYTFSDGLLAVVIGLFYRRVFIGPEKDRFNFGLLVGTLAL